MKCLLLSDEACMMELTVPPSGRAVHAPRGAPSRARGRRGGVGELADRGRRRLQPPRRRSPPRNDLHDVQVELIDYHPNMLRVEQKPHLV